MSKVPNHAMDQSRRSAGNRILGSRVSGALLLVGHLER
jgi:hypothetical protein